MAVNIAAARRLVAPLMNGRVGAEGGGWWQAQRGSPPPIVNQLACVPA